MTRGSGPFVTAIAGLALLGCPSHEVPKEPHASKTGEKPTPSAPERPEGVIGYYVLDHAAFYSAIVMQDVPPGQVMYLGIVESRWMMRNMLIGYGGTWSTHEGATILTVTEGPTGKANKKEKISVTRTDQGVTLTSTEAQMRDMRFSYVGPVAPKDFGYDEFLGRAK